MPILVAHVVAALFVGRANVPSERTADLHTNGTLPIASGRHARSRWRARHTELRRRNRKTFPYRCWLPDDERCAARVTTVLVGLVGRQLVLGGEYLAVAGRLGRIQREVVEERAVFFVERCAPRGSWVGHVQVRVVDGRQRIAMPAAGAGGARTTRAFDNRVAPASGSTPLASRADVLQTLFRSVPSFAECTD